MISRTILVADEDTDTRIILRALLERAGFTIVEAANGALAQDVAQQHPLVLVVLNHPMNVSPTVSLARWLRSQPATMLVPIVNLTSRAVPAYMNEASQHGVNVSVPKPIDVQQMLHLVEELTAGVPA